MIKNLFYLIIFNLFLNSFSHALIEVDITRGNLDPLPIAVSPLHVDIKSQEIKDIKVKQLGENISKIIEYNLIVFEADGISLRLAIIAVKNITKRAEPNCFPKFVLPTYNDKIIIKQSIRRT